MINDILNDYEEFEFFGNVRTMHLGPNEVLLGAEVNFKDELKVSKLEEIVAEVKAQIKKKMLNSHIFILRVIL